jgi:hypothetical protein
MVNNHSHLNQPEASGSRPSQRSQMQDVVGPLDMMDTDHDSDAYTPGKVDV